MCPGPDSVRICPAVEIKNSIAAVLFGMSDSKLNLLAVEERDAKIQAMQILIENLYNQRDTFVHCKDCGSQRTQTA